MQMPARQFFAMLNASVKIQAIERIEECDIAAIPMCESKYYSALRSVYVSRLESPATSQEKSVPISMMGKVTGAVVDAASEDARYALTSLMMQMKRSYC